ncbi:MAG TPA: type II toxin-antitoxin system HicB family antitoxin [Gammaproteobacteria bacterium]|jgi:antitoxin HicB|nr:type II toxin-antitoxin system HicB family antitoxin [Gammaproteobacteria bacterium]MDP6731973.1 type II toxin-antitoxin system HicB family antitoxin [Gammaproteobacteria bacterium]HAJ75644.1 type II toxin-antitoxin system HicB family antitoxin [Gammaproteobacteria bacterium]|tara:strand:- start:2772 stop:3212 length:441 start_codon:yes stop_codon:yes gene_type:complete
MRYVYPVTLEQDDDGMYLASARDVPEAITDGESKEEALQEMAAALGAALAGYSIAGRALPLPSAARLSESLVPVEPLVAAKLALRSAMQEQALSNVALAKRLGVSEGAVRRLVNPDHVSRLDNIVAALSVVGRGLVIEDQKKPVAA